MKENNKGVIVLLIVIIVMLVVLCVLFATGTIKFKDNITDTKNTQINSTIENQSNNKKNSLANENSYVGEYIYTEENEYVEYKAILSLVNDGTFYIKETATMKHYYYGTYEIIGDKLKLNYTFNWANAQDSYGKMNEHAEYTINNDTITNTKNDKNVFSSDKNIILTKKSNNITLAKEFTNDILNTYR